MITLKVNNELCNLLPPLTEGQYNLLEQNIIKQGGARDPIIVWEEEGVIVDGHNRHEICERLGLSYTHKEISFANEEEVMQWMLDNQEGKRNLSHDAMRYMRGKVAERICSEPHGTVKTKLKEYADKEEISIRTVYNNKDYAQQVDSLTPEDKEQVLLGKKKIKEVIQQPKTLEDLTVAVAGRPYRIAINDLNRIKSEFKILSDSKETGGYIASKFTRIERNIEEIKDALHQCEPVKECDTCQGNSPLECSHCFGTGYLSRAAKESQEK